MNKKFIIASGILFLIVAGIIYVSVSSDPNNAYKNKKSQKNIEPLAPQNADANNNNPPPPPPRKKIGKIAPPPPPPPKFNPRKERPENYVNFLVEERPVPIHELAKGEIKDLRMKVKKGSENFTIKWMRKDGKKLTQVGVGESFKVSAGEKTQYYVIEVDDRIDRPQQIFFQVSEKEAESAGSAEDVAKVDNPTEQQIKDIEVESGIKENTVEEVKEVAKTENAKAIPKPPETKTDEPAKDEVIISTTQSQNLNLKAGTPLKLSYEINKDGAYDIFWYHRPLGKKKSALIKGKKTLKFSLKKLNKYHQGEFYIQIRDKKGKVIKSPEYKVRLK